MKLSVIIPCLNEATFIPLQLEALSQQNWSEPWEVIVADNGSTDGSVAIVERFRGKLPKLRIVDASDRKGQAHAKNVGARFAAGEALAFCDADDEVGDGWLSAMGRALSNHEFVASRFESERLNSGWVRDYRSVTHQEAGLPIFKLPPHLPYAGGCGLGVRKSVHEAVGGFDETLPVCEDADYCFRVQMAGMRLHFQPDAVMHIRFQRSLFGLYRQAESWGRNTIFLYRKYHPSGIASIPSRDGFLAWVGLIYGLLKIRRKASLASWLWEFGWRMGRRHASIRSGLL